MSRGNTSGWTASLAADAAKNAELRRGVIELLWAVRLDPFPHEERHSLALVIPC